VLTLFSVSHALHTVNTISVLSLPYRLVRLINYLKNSSEMIGIVKHTLKGVVSCTHLSNITLSSCEGQIDLYLLYKVQLNLQNIGTWHKLYKR
jgi:hypothetical protein